MPSSGPARLIACRRASSKNSIGAVPSSSSSANGSADGHVRQAGLSTGAPQGTCQVSPALANLKLAEDSETRRRWRLTPEAFVLAICG